jgi:hypothetical protein
LAKVVILIAISVVSLLFGYQAQARNNQKHTPAPVIQRYKMRMALERAKRNLHRIDLRIQDKLGDLALYNGLMPNDPDFDSSLYEENIESTKKHLALLRRKRDQLAQAIKDVGAYYNNGFTDLKPARQYASE